MEWHYSETCTDARFAKFCPKEGFSGLPAFGHVVGPGWSDLGALKNQAKKGTPPRVQGWDSLSLEFTRKDGARGTFSGAKLPHPIFFSTQRGHDPPLYVNKPTHSPKTHSKSAKKL